jgi:hypothetical protein
MRRPALAALVGIICLLAGLAVAGLLAGGGDERAPAKRAVAKAATHGGPVPGMSERELRAMETATLGADHAREHALVRRALARRARGVGKRGAGKDAAAARPAAAKAAAAEGAAAAGTASPAAAAAIPPPGDPAEVGQWQTGKVVFPVTAIHAAMLPTGKVMIFTYPIGKNSAEAWLWDPATDPTGAAMVQKNPPLLNGEPANIWCAGQTFTADGELVVFGGNLEFPLGNPSTSTWKGLNKVYTFNPYTETWATQPDMRHGRWYPTGVRLADGRIPIISGLDESGAINPSSTNPDVEVFTPPATIGGQGTISFVGTVGGAGKPPIGGLYPHMFAMPSGRTLIAGPAPEDTWAFTGLGDPYQWAEVPNLLRPRSWGTSVPLPAGPGGSTKIMALGGTDWTETPSTTTTEVYDEAQPGLGWQPAAPNLIGRGHGNTVLLPDGSMAEVGGGHGRLDSNGSALHAVLPEHRQVELWDPITKEWQLGPAQTEGRAYHSTAVLLPDGRVLSAGDEWNGDGVAGHVDTGEIYEPPYLFRGPRPTISSAPTDIKVGTTFGVSTPNTNVASAALVAPAAVTHGVDMNQRIIQLGVTRRTGCVSITAPNANAAPPGPYMLFLLNDQGVPSVAKFVKLQQAITPPACTTAIQADTADPSVSFSTPADGATVSGQVQLKAAASDSDGVIAGVQFRRDGVNIGAEDTRAPFSATLDTTQITNASHELTAVARDDAGHTSTAAIDVTVNNVDVTDPAVAITTPKAGTTVSGSIPVSALAGDLSGIKQVQFMVDGQKLGPPVLTEPHTMTWHTTDVTNGDHTLTAVALDNAGNSKTSSAVSVTVDNPDPPPTDPVPPEPLPQPPPPGGEPPAAAPSGPIAVPNLAPALGKLKWSRASFRKGKSTTLSFTLTEPARVTVSFDHSLAGRRVRGRCVKPREGRRSNCTRYVRMKTKLSVRGKAGANAVVVRARGFEPGRYRVTLQATDATGERSGLARTGFRLLESASKARAKSAFAAVLSWF